MKQNKGFTLLELMITVAIIGIIASIAVPSFSKMIERNRLTEVAVALQADMQLARIRAIKQSQNIFVSRTKTSATAGDWCYGLNTANCDCTTANDCAIKTVSGANFSTVQMLSLTDNSNFDFRRGTPNVIDGVTFHTSNYAVRVVFSKSGRVRLCTPPTEGTGTAAANRPVGTVGLAGKPNCP